MSSLAYHRKYNLRRYHQRRAAAIQKLGGKCVRCGSTDSLEFDHIDRSSKAFDAKRWMNVSLATFWQEVAKCQLLCLKCHQKKSLAEAGRVSARGTHGTISAYRYCGPPRCTACKKAKADVHSAWRKKCR